MRSSVGVRTRTKHADPSATKGGYIPWVDFTENSYKQLKAGKCRTLKRSGGAKRHRSLDDGSGGIGLAESCTFEGNTPHGRAS